MDGHVICIYIYAFSRRFYPKWLTVHSGYTYFCQYMCSLGIEPTTFALLRNATGTQYINLKCRSKYVSVWPVCTAPDSDVWETSCSPLLSSVELFSGIQPLQTAPSAAYYNPEHTQTSILWCSHVHEDYTIVSVCHLFCDELFISSLSDFIPLLLQRLTQNRIHWNQANNHTWFIVDRC